MIIAPNWRLSNVGTRSRKQDDLSSSEDILKDLPEESAIFRLGRFRHINIWREKNNSSRRHAHLGHRLQLLLKSRFLLFGLEQLLLPFIQLALELTHQLITISLRDFLHKTQLICVPLFQLPILRKTEKTRLLSLYKKFTSYYYYYKSIWETTTRGCLLELCSSDCLLFGVVFVHFLRQ